MNTQTEASMKTKWCPFVRAMPLGANQNYGDLHTTRDFSRPEDRNCIGSGCAAWQWETGTHGFCGLIWRR